MEFSLSVAEVISDRRLFCLSGPDIKLDIWFIDKLTNEPLGGNKETTMHPAKWPVPEQRYRERIR